ncbi:MAG: hypothetical protein GX265_02360 [Mollicutes bacterium]|nr:hypothetical protein [Mollicutes bacterium]
MDTIIKEINESLTRILNDLENRRLVSQKDLDVVTAKINEKVDEAKDYKVEVDNAKGKIKALEKEIESLEIDLNDLNERFGKKDFNVILEAGNREINAKIMEKQNQITKHRQKIAELTERARSIKDLLINLKKDRKLKEERLDIVTKAYEYYNESLNKIIEYAKNNPNSLNNYGVSYPNLNFEYTGEPMTEVFDEIESMDNNEDKPSEIDLTPEEEANLDDLFEKLKNKNNDLEELNKSIDEEYKSIFGEENTEPEENTEDTNLNITENDLNTPLETTNIFDKPIEDNLDIPDIFGNENNISTDSSDKIISFFYEYGLDFNKFTTDDQEIIKNIFDESHFRKILEILKNNQINLEKIYNATRLFEKGEPEELDQILTKLLLAEQTKLNVENVLNNLGNITSANLSEVINSFGPNIKDAEITDIIMKAENLTGNIEIEEPKYLYDYGYTNDDLIKLENNAKHDIWIKIIIFPEIIKANYEYLQNVGINNLKEVFIGYPHMFTKDPDKFKAIFVKYDQADLIRCIEKNPAVIEKL